MKKIFAVILCLISVLSASMLGGCNMLSYDPKDHERKEDGFTYYLIDKNGDPSTLFKPATGAAIFGADETEELVIPEKLGGHPVTRIGAEYGILGGRTYTYGIYAKNIKRVVINHDVSIWSDGLREFEGCLILNYPIRFPTGLTHDYTIQRDYKYTVQINCDPNLMNDYEKNVNDLGKSQYEIKFDATGGEKTTWATIIWKDNLLPKPEDPIKQGVEFAGWFVDEAYETEWHFEEDTVSESMTLYAKWI